MNVIAFSLWGDNPRYTLGALQNASLAKIVYPDWVCRFYVGVDTPVYIRELLSDFDNTEIVETDEDGSEAYGMFWRFRAAADPKVTNLIVRDCDSRLWFREAKAVEQWLASDKDFHIMRDHEYHNAVILGGMWGVRNGLLQGIEGMMSMCGLGDYWQADQEFLRDVVYRHVEPYAFVHDERFDCNGHKFPTKRNPKHFVGQAYAGCGRILDATEYFQDFIKGEMNA
tara:strand:+ start:11023 stop:11700 length:678 start_codon:yes stop_codon:yes gene_type:complete